MNQATALLLLALFSGALVAPPTHALGSFETGEAVMQAAHEQARKHSNQRAEVKLVIKNANGKTRTRRFRLWHKIFPGRTKSLMKFHHPASVKGTGLLSETLDAADVPTQWIYLPAFRSVKRLNAEEQNNSFVGSDFTNGDIAGRQISRDRHRITSEDDEKIYIESRPRDAADPYSRMEVEMLREILVPARIVFYDRGGEKLKTLFNARIRKIKNMYLVTEALMTNHQTGGTTTIRKTAVDLERGISENQVGIKGLQK